MNKYMSNYTDRFILAQGNKYDEAVLRLFEDMLWDIEKRILLDFHHKYLKGSSKINYLDFACGTGRILSFMHRHIENATGVDTSHSMLSCARAKTQARLVEGNIVNDKNLLNGEEFDLITSFRLFLNLEPHNRQVILESLYPYLKANGYLVVNNHMNRYSILGIIAFLIKTFHIMPPKFHAPPGKRRIINTMSEYAFRQTLKKCGFKVVKVYRYGLLPGHGSCILMPRNILLLFERFMSKITLLNLFCKEQIYVCQKSS